MSTMVVTTRVTHRYLMNKTKSDLASWIMDDFDTIEKLQDAIKGLLKEPYGCPMCDSGVLRNPVNPERTPKEHHPDCPYAIAAKLVEGL